MVEVEAVVGALKIFAYNNCPSNDKHLIGIRADAGVRAPEMLIIGFGIYLHPGEGRDGQDPDIALRRAAQSIIAAIDENLKAGRAGLLRNHGAEVGPLLRIILS